MAEENASDETESTSVWILSTPGEGGTYRLELQVGQDIALTLTQQDAMAWASYVASTLAVAEMDSAVLRQTRDVMKMPREMFTGLIVALRSNRRMPTPPIDCGLTFLPGVSNDCKPFLHLYLRGEPIGQWESLDVERHVTGVLIAAATVELDEATYRTLTTEIELSPDAARAMISDIARHHTKDHADE